MGLGEGGPPTLGPPRRGWSHDLGRLLASRTRSGTRQAPPQRQRGPSVSGCIPISPNAMLAYSPAPRPARGDRHPAPRAPRRLGATPRGISGNAITPRGGSSSPPPTFYRSRTEPPARTGAAGTPEEAASHAPGRGGAPAAWTAMAVAAVLAARGTPGNPAPRRCRPGLTRPREGRGAAAAGPGPVQLRGSPSGLGHLPQGPPGNHVEHIYAKTGNHEPGPLGQPVRRETTALIGDP